MLGPALGSMAGRGMCSLLAACGCSADSMSTSKSIGAVKSTATERPLLTSKKSALRKAEKSSSAGCGSASTSWSRGGDSWLRFAMYWDTFGPRWPL